jgi:hypothetical protein
MKRGNCFVPLALAMLVPVAAAVAQEANCHVEPFRGATLPQGAVTSMRVANTSRSCVIINYGLPGERSNPAESGKVTRQAEHGKAEFVAPEARYIPMQGYVGPDEFEYEALARNRTSQPVRLKVLVKVTVVAP